MTDALAAILDARGRPPRQGDGDDGRGLLLDHPDYHKCTSLLATGKVLFGACNWWPSVPCEDVRTTLWTATANPPGSIGHRPATRPSLFADAGMALLRDHAGEPGEIWCRCDHGPHGYLSIAAHAHADALSIEVRHGGIDVLADPGTYCYHGEPEWRAYFRSTLGHNTLELSGSDQSTSRGPFLWVRHAQTRLIRASGLDDGPLAEWTASHNGYDTLNPAAVHQRTVKLDRTARRVIVEDIIESRGEHPCRLAFHLGPTVQCSLENAIARLSWQVDHQELTAVMATCREIKDAASATPLVPLKS